MFSALIKVVRWTGNKKTRILCGFAYSFLISLVSAAPIAIAAWAMCGFLGLSNGEKPDLKIALTAGLAIIASIALRAALMWLRARAEETVAAERSNEVRVRIGEALKRVPLGYFDNHPSGEILSALTTELSFVEIHGMRMVDMLGNGYITAAAMVAFLAFMDLRACILALAAIAVATVVLELMFKNSARLSPAQNDAREDMAQATLEYIHGMPVVKSYRQVDAAVSAVRSAYARSRNVNLKTELAFQPFNALLLFVTRSASVGVIVIVCISFLNGTISLLTFCTLVMFSFTLFQSIEACGDAAYVIGHIGEVIDRLDAIESAPAIDDNCKAVKLEHHNLEMHDVSFAYGDGPLVLNGMSLTIPEGTTAALVGGSGSGKTTVAKLFARFYDATGGSVRIGGHDVRELLCNSILEDFSMVFQDVYLMDDTIERNIALSRPDAQFEEIV
ncbi:MAG: ABC transporter ATP-binding protein, partial [Atopobium sp.]|nr:ABC transporter ATP-binding protein [Atopobium sp.]